MISPFSILIVAGERSGDVYGGELVSVLRARINGVQVFGCGGSAMREAGVETVVDAHSITMAGITEVIAGLPRVQRAFRVLLNEVGRRKPQIAILIDFPDFNLRLAKELKRRNVPVIYFVSPQIWAWRRGRIRQLKATIQKMLCIFDFEEEIYREAGIPVECVGHPLVDLVRTSLSREEFFARVRLDAHTTTVALLPGSRPQEVHAHLPVMLEAAARLALSRRIQFIIAVAPGLDVARIERLVAGIERRAAVRIVVRATYDALHYSDAAVVASGTATVEAALCECPMVVVYRVSPLSWLVGKALVKVPFYSMVNLIARRRVVEELMQSKFTALNVASRVEYLLDHPEARESMLQDLRALRSRLGQGGAILRAANAVAELLEYRETTPAQPSASGFRKADVETRATSQDRE
ncbi:MAG TPA: lipid-A-disaccharide synthase [Terriglobia bacterium]|nr:lipid-A-disaccharide synthase [Terriglobia bacterium]